MKASEARETTMGTETATMTELQATDEALLLFLRKMRRLHPAEFRGVWAKLPEGAQTAILTAELRADLLRDRFGPGNLQYPAKPDLDAGDEE